LIIKLSQHAEEMMIYREISMKEIEDAIKQGVKYFQEPGKIVSDYQYFSVVYKKIKEAHYVITVKSR